MRHKGFTLIEMSIVLVIIGLLVGGVVIGKEMIEAAKMRSGLSQLASFKTAAEAFKLKYQSIRATFRMLPVLDSLQDMLDGLTDRATGMENWSSHLPQTAAGVSNHLNLSCSGMTFHVQD